MKAADLVFAAIKVAQVVLAVWLFVTFLSS